MKKVCLLALFATFGALAADNDVISKLAPYADYSFMQNTELTLSEETQDLDIRSVNCANKDLSKYNQLQLSN